MVKIIISVVLSVTLFYSCSELNKKKEDNNAPLAAAAFLALQQQSGNCVSSAPVAAIDGANRTKFSVVKDGCGTSPGATITADSGVSFSGGSFVAGATEGKFAPSGSYATSGPVNIEIVYTITAADGEIDVIGNAAVNGAVATGPAFRITTTTIVPVSNTGAVGSLEKTVPTSSVNSEKTLCLEIHREGAGAHVFGWSKACSSLTLADRGAYEFEREDFSTAHPGGGVGFRLKNAKIKEFTITQGKIGSAGKLLE